MAITSLTRWATEATASLASTVIIDLRRSAIVKCMRLRSSFGISSRSRQPCRSPARPPAMQSNGDRFNYSALQSTPKLTPHKRLLPGAPRCTRVGSLSAVVLAERKRQLCTTECGLVLHREKLLRGVWTLTVCRESQDRVQHLTWRFSWAAGLNA